MIYEEKKSTPIPLIPFSDTFDSLFTIPKETPIKSIAQLAFRSPPDKGELEGVCFWPQALLHLIDSPNPSRPPLVITSDLSIVF